MAVMRDSHSSIMTSYLRRICSCWLVTFSKKDEGTSSFWNVWSVFYFW